MCVESYHISEGMLMFEGSACVLEEDEVSGCAQWVARERQLLLLLLRHVRSFLISCQELL